MLTCYQSNDPTCLDLILTNIKDLFKLSDTFETGLSDHHKLILTILKSGGLKGKPKEKIYRSYRQFNSEGFKKDLEFRLVKSSSFYDDFETTFLKELNRHAPLKKKILRHNNNCFMTKELRKAIMLRSKLKNIFNKNKINFSWQKYKHQRNLCLNLLRKTKKQYFAKLNVKDVADNKLFWENVKPYFSDKGPNSTKITPFEKDIIITDEKQIANIMNDHFVSITKKLSLKPSIFSKNSKSDIFHDHIIIKKIKEIYPEIVPNSFKFEPVTKDDIKNEIQNLNVKKS